MNLLVFGLSITSSWGNGHATVYRGLLKELHRRGLDITFVEKDVPWYAGNRDLPWAPFARVLLYQDVQELLQLLEAELPKADVVLMGSYFPDGILLADLLAQHLGVVRLYYDIDTPLTLEAFAREGATTYLRADQLPLFDAVLSFTGGPALIELQQRWGAGRAFALYCGLDPETHARTQREDRFRCRLGYMGTYSADRHVAWEDLFLNPAQRHLEMAFVLAGPQYPAMQMPPNVRHFQHLSPSEHPAFYSSSDLTLNITRGPMVFRGYSPSVRLFEAAGCGCCIVSDRWEGLGEIFEVGSEVLVAENGDDMSRLLARLPPEEAMAIGERARNTALREHSYEARAGQFLEIVGGL